MTLKNAYFYLLKTLNLKYECVWVFLRWRMEISWTDDVRNEELLLESRSRGISYMK
jgi:hypothetical protein